MQSFIRLKELDNVNDKKPTHLLLSKEFGGKLHVPKELEYKFLVHYADEMKKCNKLYYVEVRPDIFKYMIDIDLSDSKQWTHEEILDLSKIINKVVSNYYTNNICIVSTTNIPKIKGAFIHTGIHINWPKININSEIAMIIREHIVDELNKFEKIAVEKKWDTIIDERIYKSNGFRMIYSDKMAGTEPENRIYMPLYVLNNDTVDNNYLERLNNNFKDLVLDTSIRYLYTEGLTELKTEIKKKSCIKNIISENSLEPKCLIDFMNETLPEIYRDTFYCVKKTDNGNYSIKTKSRYCMNIEKEHNSCGVYFMMFPSGLQQRCFCTCDTLVGRKHGYCKEFKSKTYTITEKLRKELFGPDISDSLIDENLTTDKTTTDKKTVKKIDTVYKIGMTSSNFAKKNANNMLNKLVVELKKQSN